MSNCNFEPDCWDPCCRPGPPGPQGPRGERGPAGPQGPQGEPGAAAVSYFQAWQTGLLASDPQEGSLTLEERTFTPGEYESNGSVVTAWRPGLYDVQFMVQVPAGVEVNDTVSLQYDNQTLPNMVLPISHTAGSSAVYTARGVVRLAGAGVFRLRTGGAVRYTGEGTLASLQLLRIG